MLLLVQHYCPLFVAKLVTTWRSLGLVTWIFLQLRCMLYLFVVKLATAWRSLWLFEWELLFMLIETSSLFSNVSILDKFALDEALLLWGVVREIYFILIEFWPGVLMIISLLLLCRTLPCAKVLENYFHSLFETYVPELLGWQVSNHASCILPPFPSPPPKKKIVKMYQPFLFVIQIF